MKVKNLSKLPKRKVTVDDLLGADRVVDTLEEIYEERHDLDEFIIIHTSRKHSGIAYQTNGMAESRIIYFLEAAKYSILDGDNRH